MAALCCRRASLLLVAAFAVAGCAHTQPTAGSVGERVAATARQMVGVPYRFGGASPHGFDCSGLAWYAYSRAGIAIPRTARDQYHASRKVPPKQLAPGDLLFFDTAWRQGHVGIYLGDGRFVHAPKSGQRVAVVALDDPYYRHRLLRIGRF